MSPIPDLRLGRAHPCRDTGARNGEEGRGYEDECRNYQETDMADLCDSPDRVDRVPSVPCQTCPTPLRFLFLTGFPRDLDGQTAASSTIALSPSRTHSLWPRPSKSRVARPLLGPGLRPCCRLRASNQNVSHFTGLCPLHPRNWRTETRRNLTTRTQTR